MTTLELKREFLVGYDKVASLAAPGYTDSEISIFLSKAQERFVKRRYNPKGNIYQEGYEETEKRRKDLEAVTKSGTGVVSASQDNLLSSSSVAYDLPSDHWLTIIEWVETTDTCDPIKKVVPKTHDQYFEINENPFKKPDSKKLWRLDLPRTGTLMRHEIIKGGTYTINNYNFRYIKTLTNIDITNDITSELNSTTHREIVDMAVTIALENSQEPRAQSHGALEQQAE